MRNPLSAILQCSDEITSSLSEFRLLEEQAQSGQKLSDILESSIDAAQTIALCAQHQVRFSPETGTITNGFEIETYRGRHPHLVQAGLGAFNGHPCCHSAGKL
jgi:hypothetical protein